MRRTALLLAVFVLPSYAQVIDPRSCAHSELYGTMPGGVKEKTHQPLAEQRQIRFQGRVYAEDGKSYLDRTTLTDLGNGRVRQLIEVSMDEGTTWRATFDAEYRPVKD